MMLVLKGAAKELSGQIPPQAVAEGGVVNGTPMISFMGRRAQHHEVHARDDVRW